MAEAAKQFRPVNGRPTTSAPPTCSAIVLAQLTAMVFQFDEISGLELAVDGERWCGWESTGDGAPVPFLTRP